MERLTDQDYRDLLEAVLDPSAPLVDRRNAVTMLRTHLDDALEPPGALEPPDGAEPDRAAEYERARRERLEGATDARCRPCRSGSHDRCLRPFIGEGADFCCCAGMDALEGAQEGGEAIETP
jgi:hypothetical protein